MKWEDYYEVKAFKEFRTYYWAVFCKTTGKRFGQGESSKNKATKKAKRVFKIMLEKIDGIILSDDR